MQNQNNNTIFNSGFYATLIEDLGDESLAWRLSYELGGMRYYIPNKTSNNHLFATFGMQFFEWLVNNYGGMSIIFPSGANNIYKRNQIQAQQMAAKGYSHNEIARRLGVHYNTARRAKKKLNNTSKQTELF